MSLEKPFIHAERNVAELTLRAVLLAICLTVILAMSNAYLALKLGILTSASIPAAIISMGVLRFFKGSTVLENNAVQTAASAGEAVAGGIVYTIPAMIIIQYWHHFDYLTNFLIAASGGILGVLFSIPLRRILVKESMLRFPEGRAIAEVLKTSSERAGISHIFLGGLVGGVLELLQLGFKLIASSWTTWFTARKMLFSVGLGFSATMVGAGFLIGPEMALSIFLGAVVCWFIALPVVSSYYPEVVVGQHPQQAVDMLWNAQLRYLGIGAMLFAGIWTFLKLIKPLWKSMRLSLGAFLKKDRCQNEWPRTEQDIPLPYILIGIFFIAAVMFVFFQFIFPLEQAGLDSEFAPTLVLTMVLYVLAAGFLFSVITAYFSGMVGVTASPGSSVVIAGMLFAAWLLLMLVRHKIPVALTAEQIQACEAITIIIGSVVTGIAAIANDNTQDLKVGQLLGATPWRQQIMLLLGVIVSALVIPPVMQLLFDVYGIAGVVPREGMDPTHTLPAPTAALMAAITEAVFRNTLPWAMMCSGAALILAILALIKCFRLDRYVRLSILGVAIGMYLPMASTVPLFFGGMIALWVNVRLRQRSRSDKENTHKIQTGTLIACGLVAGAALMDVLLAIPFSMLHSPNALNVTGKGWESYSVLLGGVTILALAVWIEHRVNRRGE